MNDLSQDVQELNAGDNDAARLAAVLETAVDAIVTTDARGNIESFNQAAEKMFACRAADVIGHNISSLMPDQHAFHHDKYMQEYGEAGKHRVLGRTRELNAKRQDGSEFPIELALSGANIAGQLFFTGIIRDISERREAEKKLQEYRGQLENLVNERTAALQATNQRLKKTTTELQHANSRLEQLARIDKLTNIGNRRAFDERLDLEWRRQQRRKKPLSLLICDIDHFKQFNDHYGHPAGDECLQKIGAALSDCFKRADEFVARYGGEEFAVILSGATLDAVAERADVLRQRIRALEIEHLGLGIDRFVSVSVGAALVVPIPGMEHSMLVEAADAALYRAKQLGRDRVEATMA